jgi:hypothetical protein
MPRRRARIATLLAVIALGTVSPQALAASSDPLKKLTDTSTYGLKYHAVDPAALSSMLSGQLTYGPTTVLNDTNHPMPACGGTTLSARPTAPTATRTLCWDTGDQNTTFWNPQGLTTSGDADDDGLWGDRAVLLSSWQVRDTTSSRYNDARVAFIDYTDTASPSYRWAYLVEPTGSGNFAATSAHTGGMIWYGNKLIVSGENGGRALKVFDLQKIMAVSTGDSTRIGKFGDQRYAYGYKYVIPLVGYYDYTNGGTCGNGTTAQEKYPLCFSSISMDRSTNPPSMVTTEYLQSAPGGRMLRYPFGADYLLSPNSSGVVAPSEAYSTQVGNMQGVASWSGRWWTSSSRGDEHGWLWGHQAGTTQQAVSSCPAGSSEANCWSLHPESLTHWASRGEIWSVTEKEGQRILFAVPRSKMP